MADVYYSIGTNTADLKTASTVTSVSGTFTFSAAQGDTIGVGDEINYGAGSSLAYISGRTSSTVYTATTATGATPSDVTGDTVNAIKRAFNSAQTAFSNSSNSTHLNTSDLVTATTRLHLPCYADGALGQCVLAGYTCSATYNIEMYAPHSLSEVGTSQRYTGEYSTSKARLATNASYVGFFRVSYFVLRDLQFRNDSDGASFYLGAYTDNIDGVKIYNNICVTGRNGSYSGYLINSGRVSGTFSIYNNIIYCIYSSFTGGGLNIDAQDSGEGSSCTAIIYNNTIKLGTASLYALRINALSGYTTTAYIKNNILQGAATNYLEDGTGTVTTTKLTNISQDGTLGTTATISFVSSTNFKPAITDILALKTGTNLSADAQLAFNIDIINVTRYTLWDIGAYQVSFARYWRGINTSWNTATNWSTTDGGGADGAVPTGYDDVFFTSNGNGSDCTLDIAAVCSIFSAVASSWTKIFNMGSYALSVASTFLLSNAVANVLNGVITQTGDANFTIGTGALTGLQTGTIILQGTGSYTNSSGQGITNMTCAAAGKITTFPSQNTSSYIINFTTGTGTLTLNHYCNIKSISGTPTFTNGGGTINGTAGLMLFSGTSGTFTMPATTFGGTISLYFTTGVTSANWTVTLGGNIVVSSNLLCYASATTSRLTFNTGTNPYYNITCDRMYIGNNLGTLYTANFNSSTITCLGVSGIALQGYNTAASTINLGSSQWVFGNSVTLYSNYTVDAGTSLFTFTAAGTLTSAAKTLYDITSSAGILTNSGTLTCHTLSTTGTAGFNSGTAAITCSSTINLSGSGSVVLTSSTITITGDASFTLNTSSTATVATCSLVLQGTGNCTITKASTLIGSLSCGYTGKITTYNGAISSGFINSITLNAGKLSLSNQMRLHPTATSAPIAGSGTIGGAGSLSLYFNGTATSVITLNPATITFVDTVSLYIAKINTGSLTVNLQTDLVIPGILYIYNNNGTNSFTFNTGTNPYYNITCSSYDFSFGGFTGSTLSTFNFYSSTITAPSIGALTLATGTININMSSGNFIVGGNFIFQSAWTVDAGTSSITFTNTATLTTAGKTLYDVTMNALTKVLTLSGTLACRTLTITAGGFNQAGNAITLSGNFYYAGATNGTLDAAITLSGNNKVFSITSAGTVTATSLVLILQGTTSITYNTMTFSRLILTTGKSYVVTASANVLTILNFIANDWSGTAGNLITLQSSSAGNHAHISAPVGAIIEYANIKDIHNI